MIRIGNFSLNASGVIIAVWSFCILAFTGFVLTDVAIFDHYMFRQTQVATVVRELFDGGPWLAYLMPVLGPPWTAPMEFPVYQILTAELAHLTGLNLETSGRLVSLLSGALGLVFVARALFLAGLGTRESAIALFFIAISPMYVYWSHAVMIETLAFMLSMGTLLAALEFTERGRLWPVGLGAVCAILAALAKSTTFGVFAIVIFVVFGLKYLRFAWENRTQAGAIVERGLQWMTYGIGLLGPALLLALVWVDYSDALKAASPLTTFLTSEALSNWNFGPLEEGVRAMSFIVTPFRGQAPPLAAQALGMFWVVVFAFAAFGLVMRGRQRWALILVLVIGFAAGPLVFRNLYETHYYYWVANMPFLLALVGLGVSWGADVLGALAGKRLPQMPRWGGMAILAAPLVIALAGSAITYRTFFIERTFNGQANSPRTLGAEMREFTGPDEAVMVFGAGWTPIYQYAADRPMIMLRAGVEDPWMNHLLEMNAEIDAVMFCRGARDRQDQHLAHPFFADYGAPVLRLETGGCRLFQIDRLEG